MLQLLTFLVVSLLDVFNYNPHTFQDKRSTTVDYYNPIYDEDDYLNILNIMDYPVETLEDEVLDENWAAKLGPIPTDVVFQDLPPPAGTGNCGGGGGGGFSGGRGCPTENYVLNDTKPDPILHQETYKPQQRSYESYESHSPDSVLEQRPATSAIKQVFGPEVPIPVKSRTKRSRSTLTENPWSKSTLPIPLTLKKKKKKNFNNFTKTENNEPKKCLHCDITKTPQWREGPKGPKTLCNACGVRWRSGRLYDEYRPAASPSFVPNLHSNSHRKVIEIIKKKNLIID